MRVRPHGAFGATLLALLSVTIANSAVAQSSQQSLLPGEGPLPEIEVRARDHSGAAIQYAQVQVWSDTGEKVEDRAVDLSGRFRLKVSTPGAYDVIVRALGFETHAETILALQHSITEFDVWLDADPVAAKSGIDVFLLDFSGAPVPDHRVFIDNRARLTVAGGTTNGAGRVRLLGLPPDVYDVKVWSGGSVLTTARVTVRQDEIARVDLTPYSPDMPLEYCMGCLLSPDPVVVDTSSYVLIPEVPVPEVPQPAVLPQSPHHNRFRQFFSSLGRKLGMSS